MINICFLCMLDTFKYVYLKLYRVFYLGRPLLFIFNSCTNLCFKNTKMVFETNHEKSALMCGKQWKLKLDCTSAQSDYDFPCLPQLSFWGTIEYHRTLIKLYEGACCYSYNSSKKHFYFAQRNFGVEHSRVIS